MFAVTATKTLADFVGSATLVAFTVTAVSTVTTGAVNSPEFEITPAVADQTTDVFVEPVTIAVNCLVPPEEIVADAGETDTIIVGIEAESVVAETLVD